MVMRPYRAVVTRRSRALTPSNRHATFRGQGVRTLMKHPPARPRGAHPVPTRRLAVSVHALLRPLKLFVAVARRCRALAKGSGEGSVTTVYRQMSLCRHGGRRARV
jgi:hypothetical protein